MCTSAIATVTGACESESRGRLSVTDGPEGEVLPGAGRSSGRRFGGVGTSRPHLLLQCDPQGCGECSLAPGASADRAFRPSMDVKKAASLRPWLCGTDGWSGRIRRLSGEPLWDR